MILIFYYLFKGVVVIADPKTACREVKPLSKYNQSGYSGNWFLLIDVDDCDFDKKVCNLCRITGHLFCLFI